MVTHDVEEAIYMADRVMIMTLAGQVLDTVEIELARPRTQGVRLTSEFQKLKEYMWDQLRIR